MNSIELETWSELYKQAVIFRDARPWSWMTDTEPFGVGDPYSGEIGYCYILGRLGEVHALVVAMGTEGLLGFLMVKHAETNHIEDYLFRQKCLIASFENRDQLLEEDLKIIKQLGLKFRGKRAWPMFRNYKPGYYPWFLEESDVRFLTVALEQSLNVALRYKKDRNLLRTSAVDLFFVRKPRKINDTFIWEDSYQTPRPLRSFLPENLPFDESSIASLLLKKGTRGSGAWELDMFHYPQAMQEKGKRPFFPFVIAVLEHDSGQALFVDMIPVERFVERSREILVEFLENCPILPESIYVRTNMVLEVIRPITHPLGIRVILIEDLYYMNMFRRGLYKSVKEENENL
ncbi:MAG: hypothetical protein N2317_00265 [Syntrophales bacterium]|nr:hypothetical protein [Syntrophales bacterium]